MMRRGRQTFESYVLEKWLPHHLLEPGVRKNYAGHIRNQLLPVFGPMKMRDIMPEHVREWVTAMKDKGASAHTIAFAKGSVLNAIFTTALADGVVTLHPSHGARNRRRAYSSWRFVGCGTTRRNRASRSC